MWRIRCHAPQHGHGIEGAHDAAEEEELGDKAPPRQVPRTLDNTRDPDETVVGPEDAEILEDERTDEFSDYFLRNFVNSIKFPIILRLSGKFC